MDIKKENEELFKLIFGKKKSDIWIRDYTSNCDCEIHKK